MLFDAQHGGRRHGAGGCGQKKRVVTLNSRAFHLFLFFSPFLSFATQPVVYFNNRTGVCVQLRHTRVVDRRHLNSARGQRGLGLEPVPFKRRHRGEEVVLVPAVLLGRRKAAMVQNGWNGSECRSISARSRPQRAQQAVC